MSATLSATSATSQATAEWVKLFPRQVTETYTSSVTFMKQLTVVAVSTIMYLKNIFPQENYTVETLGGIKLKILKKKCRDELAQFISTGLIQAFEAFDKKYLHQLALCLYEGQCHADNLVECHMFEFTYNSAGAALSVRSTSRDHVTRCTRYQFDDVRAQTVRLLQACIVTMQVCHSELPTSSDISLRLYYNEDAPEGYQAPGFVSTPEADDHLGTTYGDFVRLGCVETRFHRLVAHSYMRESVPSSREANASENVPMMTQNDELCSERQSESASDAGMAQVRCPCNQYVSGDDLVMLTCDYCNTTQHAACFGVTRDMAPRVARHCCADCFTEDPARQPTDARLAVLPPKKRECLCVFRRALEWCARGGAASAGALAARLAVPRAAARSLLRRLRDLGVLHCDTTDTSDDSPHEVIQEQVAIVMSKFFQTEENSMVDRLVAETLSQGSQSDPVGDVLAPMEKVTLQNSTTMGKIIHPTPLDTTAEDSTLKQYREAMYSFDHQTDEQLPLSGSHNPVKNMEKIGKITKRKIDPENRQLRSGVKAKMAKLV